jgi:hypothetical protein
MLGRAWQVTGCGVRQVLIRQTRGTRAYISRFVGLIRAPGDAAGFALNTSMCLFADLFENEAHARAEHRRRRKLTHSAIDRRCRIAAPEAAQAATG